MDAMMKVMGDMQKQIEKAQKEQIAEQRELRSSSRGSSRASCATSRAPVLPTPIRESRCGSSS